MLRKLMLSLGINSVLKALSLFLSLYQIQWLFRYISSEDLAHYNIAMSYMAAISLFIGFGLATTLQKWYTNDHSEKTRANVWTTGWYVRLISFLVGIVLTLSVLLISRDLSLTLLALLFVNTFVIICDYSFSALYNVREEAWKFSVTDFCGKLITTLLLVSYTQGLRFTNTAIYDFLLILTIGSLVTLLLDFVWLRRYVTGGVFDAALLKIMLPGMALIGFSGFLVGIYQYSQPIFMQRLGISDRDINGFAKAFTFVAQINFALGSVIPQFSSSLKRRLLGTKTNTQKQAFFSRVLLLSLGGLLGIYMMAVLVAPYYFGFVDPEHKYPLSASIFPILAAFIVPSALATLILYLSVFENQERWHFWVVCVQLVIGVGLMLWLIPAYGAIGAAWSVLIVGLIDAFLLRIPQFFITLGAGADSIDRDTKVSNAS